MAVKSAFSCVFSFLRPLAAQPLTAAENSSTNPSSPRTPIFEEGRAEDSSTAVAVRRQQQHVCAASSPPVSPFITPVAQEKSLRVFDPSSFLVERLDEGWFEDNVLGIEWWWDICTRSWGSSRPEEQPSTGDLMAWVPSYLSDSELYLGPPSGIRTPDSSSSQQYPGFAAIEMVQPLVSGTTSGDSSAADRDPRGLPGSRFRRLPRVYPEDDMSLSDGEQRHYLRAQSEDPPDALRRLSERRLEPAPKAKLSLRRRKDKLIAEVVEPARCFSDGEESGGGAGAPLFKVREGVVSQQGSSRASKTYSVSKIRNSTKMDRAAGKVEGGSSERETKRPQKFGSGSMIPPLTRWRRRDRRKNSKSLPEFDYDELRGLIDLGFNFTHDDTPPGVVPRMKFHSKDGDDLQLQSPNKSSTRSRIRSPRGWPKHPDPPLLKWRIPSLEDSTVDTKAHMKFWAHSVASTVSAEC